MTHEIKAAIESAAAQNNRSMNAEILARLRRSFTPSESRETDPKDVELLDILDEIEQLKAKIIRLRKSARSRPER